MFFTFKVHEVQYEGDDSVITGYLESGAIAGPERVTVPTRSGKDFASTIMAMEVEGPIAHPIPASQRSRIQLVLQGCPQNRDIPVPCFAVGSPFEESAPPEWVDRSELIARREFWAMHFYLLLGTDDHAPEEFLETFFHLSGDTVNDFYVEHFSPKNEDAPWTYLTVPVASGFSLKIEYARGGEFQERYTVQHFGWPNAVLLGYDSGHFALPAFRWQELKQIAKCLSSNSDNEIYRKCGLLLFLPPTYLTADDDLDDVRNTLIDAWHRVPVLKVNRIEELVDQICQGRMVNGFRWWRDSKLGWINDGIYSPRNPKTHMCDFDSQEFEKIKEFSQLLESGTDNTA